MTREKGLRPSLPMLAEDTGSYAHVKKVKKKNQLAKSASGQRLLRSTASSRARARSVSPKSGPWVPAPGKATKAGRVPWQVACTKLEVAHVRNSDLSTDDEERLGGEVRKYEKKINNLINEVGTLRNEVVLQKALQEIEHREDLLNTSSHMLQRQEAELHQVEADLVATETENKLLRQNMEFITEEAELTKTQKEQLSYERERLMKKLIEAELDGQAAAHQVRELRDLIRLFRDEQRISAIDQARLIKQKDVFLKTLSDFEATNRSLQHLLRDQHSLEISGLWLGEQRDVLLGKLADSDLMNERMRSQLLDCEAVIADLKDQLVVEKEERLVLNNLQGSLESNRGHLQKQLRNKEADCNRMSVQIRSLENHLLREKVEKDQFQEMVNSFRSRTDKDKEALKKAARAQKSRAERLEQELCHMRKHLMDLESQDLNHLPASNVHFESLSTETQRLTSERDQLRMRVTELEAQLEKMQENARSECEALTARLHETMTEISELRLECERTRSSVSVDEGKMKQMEEDVQQLRVMVKHYEQLVEEYKEQASHVRSAANESSFRLEEQAREKEQLHRDGELELEKVKQRLHQRLQELEPLPELLRAAELRLQEANETIVSLEKKNVDNTKLIAELTAKIDYNSESLGQFRIRCSESQDSNKSLQSRSENLERRLRELEDRNSELQASQVKLQESLRQESLGLEDKARENASLTRQLEIALSDSRHHSEQSRDRYLSKERTYQTRIVDLEGQLNQLRADQTRLKREKEETERKFNSRLYDLKDRLEQYQSSNRSMQNYVQFLKNSYSNVFGDTPSSLKAPPSPVKPYP